MAIIQKECLKCNTKTKFENYTETTTCPKCGVVYSKAEASQLYREHDTKVYNLKKDEVPGSVRTNRSKNGGGLFFWLVIVILAAVFFINTDMKTLSNDVAKFFEVDKETVKQELTNADTIEVIDLDCSLTAWHPQMQTDVYFVDIAMKLKLNHYKNLDVWGRLEILDNSYNVMRMESFNVGMLSSNNTSQTIKRNFKINGIKNAEYCRLKEFNTVNGSPICFTDI